MEEIGLTPYQGPNRRFGLYECKCGNAWSSAASWANKSQECQECGRKFVYLHKQYRLRPPLDDTKEKPHPAEDCEMCKYLLRICTDLSTPH